MCFYQVCTWWDHLKVVLLLPTYVCMFVFLTLSFSLSSPLLLPLLHPAGFSFSLYDWNAVEELRLLSPLTLSNVVGSDIISSPVILVRGITKPGARCTATLCGWGTAGIHSYPSSPLNNKKERRYHLSTTVKCWVLSGLQITWGDRWHKRLRTPCFYSYMLALRQWWWLGLLWRPHLHNILHRSHDNAHI